MEKIKALLRQQFAQCVFTHKTHECAAERNETTANRILWSNVAIVAMVLTSMIFQLIYPDERIYSYVGAGITVGEIVFLIIQLSFSFQERAASHKSIARQYLGLRDDYAALLSDAEDWAISESEIILRRNSLMQRYRAIAEASLPTNSDDYANAQRKLFWDTRNGEEYTWTKEEINRFLPDSLRQ